MTITRRHHPLLNQSFPVLHGRGVQLVIRLADGSAMSIPRDWTDVDGTQPSPETGSGTQLTVPALRDLLELVDSLRRDRH